MRIFLFNGALVVPDATVHTPLCYLEQYIICGYSE